MSRRKNGFEDYNKDWEILDVEEISKEEEIQNLFGSLGFFIVAFSKVEMALTALLATMMQNKDFEAFHTLTKGLDAPAKAARIKELGESKKIFEHKNDFGLRLHLFKETIGNFRNRISHSYIALPADAPVLGFYDISYFTEDPKPVEYVATQEMINLCEEWLEHFYDDLSPIIRHARARTKMTIGHPKSMEPEDFRRKLQKLESAAKRRIRPKKASRKLLA